MPSARLFLSCLVVLLLTVSLAFLTGPVHGQSSTASYEQYSAFVPVGVDVDGAGAMYVADSECDCVIKLSRAGREVGRYNISSRYLRGVPPYVTDVAVDPAGSIYVAGSRGYPTVPIVKLSAQGELLAQLVINPRRLFDVRSIAVDSAGALYAADTYSAAVYRFDSSSTQPTANYSVPGLLAPVGVTVDAAGFVYIIGESRFLVLKFAANGTLVQTMQGAARYVPIAVAVDSVGNVLVMAVHSRIRTDVRFVTFSPAGVQLFNFSLGLPLAAIEYAISSGTHFRLDSTDAVYLAFGRAVYKLRSTDGSQLAAYNNSAPPFVTPSAIAIDAAGYMYVANFASVSSFAGLKLSPDGVVVQAFAWNVSFHFSPIAWHTRGSDSFLYVLDSATNAVVQLSLAGTVLANFSTSSPALGPIVRLAVDPTDGTLLVADYFHDRVLKFAPNNTVLAVYSAPYPSGVAVDAAHNVYIVWSTLARVEKRSADGRSLFNFTTSDPRLYQPMDVALDAASNVYINDFQNGRVVQLSPAGKQMAVYTTNSSAPYMASSQMAVDPQGAHVLAWNHLTLIKFTTNNTAPSTNALLRGQEASVSVLQRHVTPSASTT